MKIGFSSSCCPTWDLHTIIEQAALMEFNGVELCDQQGEQYLPSLPELSQKSEELLQACAAKGVELVCLSTSARLNTNNKQETNAQEASIREYIELAEKLRCPFVRVRTGDVPAGTNRNDVLGRMAESLADLVHFAGRHQVVLLIENSGDLASSRDIWFLLDAVSHPSLQACWNPLNGLSRDERPSTAVPSLVTRLSMVHMADASFDGTFVESYRLLGEGNLELERLIELLWGVCFNGYLMADWPDMRTVSLAEQEEFLPQAAKFLKAQLSIKRQPLTAYKGDKHAPKFA